MRPPSRLPSDIAVVLLAGATLAIAPAAEAQTVAQRVPVPAAPTAELRDQYGRGDSLAAHRGKPQVVFVVSAPRLRRLKDWEVELDRRLEGVGFLRIADVPPEPGQPPPRFEDVAKALRRRVPEEVSILIDLERRFARDLELDTREVNVLLFDAAGGWIGHLRGRPTPENLDQVTTRLESLAGVRRRASGAPPTSASAPSR
jgi:hypothetical protein